MRLRDEERKERILGTLRPLYERGDNWKGLITLNQERLSLAEMPAEKVEVLNNTARLWEEQGDDLNQAFIVTREAFELLPEDEVTRANLERLTEALDRWGPLADSYETAVEKAEDEYIQRELYSRLSVICDEQLDDPRRALARQHRGQARPDGRRAPEAPEGVRRRRGLGSRRGWRPWSAHPEGPPPQPDLPRS